MSDFDFLFDYIIHLRPEHREHREYGYFLQPGKTEAEIVQLEWL